ncbi:MAG: PQQ-dependent sugar dehydrogenase [Devosiaceae bacterium]|nr:PQQ-dependent sugar dehydrogenase [Devosiaceae bacterium]
MKNKITFLKSAAIAFSLLMVNPSLAQESLPTSLKLTPVASGLNNPLLVVAAPGDSGLFIVQQNGVISLLMDGEVSDVLDLSAKVTFRGEAGMLGMALHPDFTNNDLAYVSYTTGNLVSMIEEYRFDRQSQSFDIASARPIYSLDQPAGNHNGGMIAFGPDGFLYVGFGDGGGAFDTFSNGQNFDTALGSFIRINIEPGLAKPYSIPEDNPDVSGVVPENWIYGLRNPWRFSFDGDLLYIADVGQSDREEIHVIAAGAASSGLNLGWPLAEGELCLADVNCKDRDLDWPVITYQTGARCAITGGNVYRGTAIPGLTGQYFYGDFCSGEVFSFSYENGKATDQRDWTQILGAVELLSGFGVDGFGELYLTSLAGTIYRLDPES